MKAEKSSEIRSPGAFAEMVGRISRSLQIDAVIGATETAELAKRLAETCDKSGLTIATANNDTYKKLEEAEFDVMRLAARVPNKYRQARYTTARTLNTERVSLGDLVICAVSQDMCHGRGNLMLITDIDGSAGDITPSDLLELTDGVRRVVLEATLEVARKIGRTARRGKPVGALFTLGDSSNVLKNSRQLVLNPLKGHSEDERVITNADVYDMIIEFAKLDGAFVIRGDGFIRSAGTYLNAPENEVDLPSGLGARHTAAAAITARTYATAITISAGDGHVRAFSGGKLVMQMDPEVPFIPTA